MGVRFACHVCNKQLNIKRELAGRRGVCPQCQSRIRIPMEDTALSSPVDEVRIVQSNASSSAKQAASQQAAGSAGNTGGAAVMAESQRVSEPAVSTPAASGTRVSQQGPVVADIQAGQALDVENPSGEGGNVQPLAAGSILEEEPDATWYVRPPSGGQYGPASTAELQEWIAQGRGAASALLWRDGWPQWRDASDALPEMSASLPGVTGGGGHEVTSLVAPGIIQRKSGGKEAAGAHSAAPLSGSNGIGAERRSRTMRRISMISILVAIAAMLIGVLFYVVNR